MANEKKTVAWFIAKKSLIKFAGEDDSFSVASAVMEVSDFVKYPIVKGDIVEVAIADEEVTFLKKVEAEDKKEEEPKEEKEVVEDKKEEVRINEEKTEAVSTETLTYILEGVYEDDKKVKSVHFVDQKLNGKKWTKLSNELSKKSFADLGLVANATVTFVLSDDIITEIKDAVLEKKTDTKKEEKTETTKTKKYSTNVTGSSIERQCAMKGAVEIVKTLLETKAIENKQIKDVVTDLTKACYKAIQEA